MGGKQDEDSCGYRTDDDASEVPVDAVNEVIEQRSPSSRPSSLCRIVTLSTAAVSVAGGAFVYFFGDVHMLPSPLRGIVPAKPLFNDESLGEQNAWIHSTGQGGLELKLINALDPEWYPFFYRAVEQWDSGMPDSLTLTAQVADADPDCSFVSGFLKICNGDYGNSGWKGINKVLLRDGKIDSSIGKMNEFYIGRNDANTMQYTMCHEIGHGFGLPHSDGSMWNLNKGNCKYLVSMSMPIFVQSIHSRFLFDTLSLSGMDYTNRPETNKQPGQVNFDTLAKLYGTVGNNNNTQNDQFTESQEKVQNDENYQMRRMTEAMEGIPKSVQKRLDLIESQIMNRIARKENAGLRALQKRKSDVPNEFKLGKGYSIIVHYLK